jgi:Tol biopolymer transport system component
MIHRFGLIFGLILGMFSGGLAITRQAEPYTPWAAYLVSDFSQLYLYRLSAQGHNQLLYTFDSWSSQNHLDWSPDGQYLLVATRPDQRSSFAQISVVDGYGRLRGYLVLTDITAVTQIRWSPDSQFIGLIGRSQNQELAVLLDKRAREVHRITLENRFYRSLRWLDAQRFVVTDILHHYRQVEVNLLADTVIQHDPDTPNLTEIATGRIYVFMNDKLGLQAPDKQTIIYNDRDFATGFTAIYRTTETGPPQRLTPPEYSAFLIDWSPDGAWILLIGRGPDDANAQLYKMRQDGSDLQRLTHDPYPKTQFQWVEWNIDGVWSPTADRVMYASLNPDNPFHTQLNMASADGRLLAWDLLDGQFLPTIIRWSPLIDHSINQPYLVGLSLLAIGLSIIVFYRRKARHALSRA